MTALAALMMLALAQAAPPAEPPPAPDIGALGQDFARLCLAPFPDTEAFEQAVASEEAGFVHAEGPDAGVGQPGERWTNGDFTLLYVDRDALPPSIPAPQCRLVGAVDSPVDHLSMMAILETQLSLVDGKSSGRGGINKTVWEATGPNGEARRLFFDSRPNGPNRYLVSLTIMQLPE